MIANVEIERSKPTAVAWQFENVHFCADLLGGVMVVSGQSEDGSPMLAIPNFARVSRLVPSYELGDAERNLAPESRPSIDSKVWI